MRQPSSRPTPRSIDHFFFFLPHMSGNRVAIPMVTVLRIEIISLSLFLCHRETSRFLGSPASPGPGVIPVLYQSRSGGAPLRTNQVVQPASDQSTTIIVVNQVRVPSPQGLLQEGGDLTWQVRASSILRCSVLVFKHDNRQGKLE